ncbi:MAG: hypothetical protein ACE5LV_09490 [Candidatus Aminicenantales bacterium]
MDPKREDERRKKDFEPLEIMGYFWLFFGLIVLVATFFVQETERVPLARGLVTNLIASALLLGAGIFSLLRGRANKKRKKGGS